MFFKKKAAATPQENAPFFAAYRDADPNGPLTVHIDPGQIESPAHGGLMLADFAQHMSRAMAQTGKADSEDAALDAIVKLFQAEIERPTGPVHGSIQN